MASIYKRGSGKTSSWYLSWWSPDGKKRIQSLRTTDRRIAKVRKAEKERDLAMGEAHEGHELNLTFAGAMRRHLDASKPRKGTLTHYTDVRRARTLNQHLGHHVLSHVRTSHIEDVLETIRTERGISTRTRNDYLKLLRSMSRWCVKRDYIVSDFTRNVERLGFVTRPRKILPHDCWEDLLRQAEGHPSCPMVAVALFGGLRFAELYALEWTDVDLTGDRPYLHICPKEFWVPKSKQARYVPVPPRLREILLPYRKEGGPCFGLVSANQDDYCRQYRTFGQQNRRYLTQWLKQMGWFHKGDLWHMLRHSYATAVAQKCSPFVLQAYLGHADVQTTQIYTHIIRDHEYHLPVATL